VSRLRLGEYHAFSAAAPEATAPARYLYLVPSAAVVRLDDAAEAVLGFIAEREVSLEDVSNALSPRWSPNEIRDTVVELVGVRALRIVAQEPAPAESKPPRK